MKVTQSNKLKNNGAALITALLITSIMAMLSIAIISEQHLFINNLITTNTNQTAYNYIQGAEDIAASMVSQYGNEQQKNQLADNKMASHRIEPLKSISFHGATINAVLADQQALYNINNLRKNTEQKVNFSHFLTQADTSLGLDQAKNLTQSIIDWMTLGNNDSYYAKLKPPYRSSHHAMASIKELLLVRGMTTKLYQKIEPYITALPIKKNENSATDININTAPAMVLTVLSPQIDLATAQGMLVCRQDNEYFNSSDEWEKKCAMGQKDLIGTTNYSKYFLLRATIHLAGQQHRLSSLITFVNNPKQTTMKQSWLVWQTWS